MNERPARWLALGVVVAIASVMLALPAAADLNLMSGDTAEVAYTAGDGVNLRDAPEIGAAILTALPEGSPLTVEDGPVSGSGGNVWYAVTAETDAGTSAGWVAANYLAGTGTAGDSTEWDGVSSPPSSEEAAAGVPVLIAAGGDSLNLRTDPSLEAEVIAAIPDGATVAVLAPVLIDAEGLGWSRVRYDGLTGYSVSNYFATIAITDGASSNGPAVVSGTGGDGVNLRDAPDIASGILTALEEDTAVQLLDGPVTGPAGDPWYQVEAFGASGWMIGDYLDPGGTNVVGDAIVAEALAYLGTPYRWAGTTPEGFDCSGFTWFVVSNVVDGDFPRPNEDQVVSGEYVAPDALLPGDLIFFQNTYQWGLSHVGIYLGDGQMISATGQYDAVGISSLDDPYWSARYLTARRIR